MYEMTYEEYEQMTKRVHKGKSLLELPTDYTIFDLETTGLSPEWDEIIEIGAIRVRGNQPVEKYQQLVKPKEEIPDYITAINGITNEMVADKPSLEEVLNDFLNFVGDDVLMGHNANFDINFVYKNAFECYGKWFTNDFVDSMRISKNLFKSEKHHRLEDLIVRFDLKLSQEHRALSDCEITKQAYDYMTNYIKENNLELRKPKHSRPDYKNLQATTEIDEDNPLFEKTVVFTGKLERYIRKDAAQIVLNCGGIFKDNIAKDVNFLVVGDTDYRDKTGKMIKAYEYKAKGIDIEIIPESVFYDMLDEE